MLYRVAELRIRSSVARSSSVWGLIWLGLSRRCGSSKDACAQHPGKQLSTDVSCLFCCSYCDYCARTHCRPHEQLLQHSPSRDQLIIHVEPASFRAYPRPRPEYSPFCSPRSSPAEARRLFCVSSAHPNGGGVAAFGTLLPTAQSSQPRMTDHRLSRRLIPLVRRCLALAQPRHRPSALALAWAPTSPWMRRDAMRWASTPTRCGEITAHRLPPPAVACTRRYAGVVADALSFFPPVQGGAKYYVSPRNYSV